MAVKVRLTRRGAKKNPHYHIVVVDEDQRRDGQSLALLGTYSPKKEKIQDKIKINSEALQAWLKKGAVLSKTVAELVKGMSK